MNRGLGSGQLWPSVSGEVVVTHRRIAQAIERGAFFSSFPDALL